jgi:hypothetical protein
VPDDPDAALSDLAEDPPEPPSDEPLDEDAAELGELPRLSVR